MYTPDITVDAVIDALGDFLEPFVGTIVRGQTNRVALPSTPCVVLTELLQVDLSVPRDNHNDATLDTAITAPTRVDVQMDFYGETAGEICRAVTAALRTAWGFDKFPATAKPLYASDPIQAPLTTGEAQYLAHWTSTASLQYNPVVIVPQESANALTAAIKPAADL